MGCFEENPNYLKLESADRFGVTHVRSILALKISQGPRERAKKCFWQCPNQLFVVKQESITSKAPKIRNA